MIPHDGYGYGKYCYWEYYARQVALNNAEFCFCWDVSSPSITISPNYDQLKCDPKYREIKIKISCIHQQPDCCQSFSKTEKELEVMFKNFYRGY